MFKAKTLLRLVLLGTLALGASALMSTTASATTATFALCAEKISGSTPAPYSSRLNCLMDNTVGGGNTEGPTAWVHTYPEAEDVDLFCGEDPTGNYEDGLCEDPGAGDYEFFTAKLVSLLLGGTNTTPSTLKGILAGAASTISCTTSKFTVEPEGGGKQSKGDISYTGCTVIKPAKCTVHEPILALFNGQLEREPSKFVDKFTGAGASEKFVELEFLNKGTETCSLGSGFKAAVDGSQTCEFDAEITMMKRTHEVICTEAGSKLKLGGETAKYSGNDIVEGSGSSKEWLGDVETEI
jgi:hypothetical protein